MVIPMIRKVSLILTTSLLIIFKAFSQGTLVFPIDKHDFGTVEEGQLATYEFEFTNTGSAPVILSDVRASCGCTTPSWPKEAIAPGAKGVIKAQYNSQGRPGTFNKTITVTSNSTEPTKMLQIKGIVEPKVATPITYTPEELKKSPKFNLDNTSYNFGKVERGQKVTTKFKIKNSGKSPLKINSSKSACSCITYKPLTEDIAPGKSAILEVTYGPNSDGKNTDIMVLSTNDLNTPVTKFTLSADVVESLTTTTPIKEEKTSVPFGK